MPTRLHSVLLVAAAAWTGGCSGPPPAAVAAATVDACTVALAPAPVRDDDDRRIDALRQDARRNVRTTQALEQLGYRFIARARARYDPGDYLLAQKAAECLLSRTAGDDAGLLLSGHALHQMHRFAEAETVARRLVAQRGLALDYGLLGDVLMEQGRVSEAAAAYQTMIDLKPFYQSYTRGAHLRWMTGDVDGAVGLMRLAVSAASPRDGDSVAWAYTRLAAYELQRGSIRTAAQAVDAALTQRPEYAPALLMRGRLLLASRQAAEAAAVLERAAQLNPLPEYQWALADALRSTGDAVRASTVERALESAGRRSDPRTLALFLATRARHTDEAVALAREEMTVRADVFTLDAVAWALFAAGRHAEADSFMTRALAEGTQDARLFLHAAAIAAAAGRPADARRWAARATAQRFTLLPSESEALAGVKTVTSGKENGS